MTTRRAAMHSTPAHASPARLDHFAYLELGEDNYYVGYRDVYRSNGLGVLPKDATRRQSTGSMAGQNGTGLGKSLPHSESLSERRPVQSEVALPNSELKLLPAPPAVAGLLPARVPMPQTNGNLIGKWVKVQGVGVGMVCRMDKRDSGNWYKVGFVCWSTSAVVWKRADALTVCSKPDGVTPYQASIKLSIEKAKVSMRG